MLTIKLSTVMAHASQRYELQLNEWVSVGTIAEVLSQHDPSLMYGTLELARTVQPEERLQDMDVQNGDRLVILTKPPRYAELPGGPRPGDPILVFSLHDFAIRSRGQTRLLMGKYDPARSIKPDIDLHNFIAPPSLDSLPDECLSFEFDTTHRQWYVRRVGAVRVMVDEFELGVQPIPVSGSNRLRFFHPTATRPIGEIGLQIESVRADTNRAYLEAGDTPITVFVGAETDRQMLNLSDNLSFERIVKALAAYNRVTLTAYYRLYWLRLLNPDTPLLYLGSNMLYAANRA